MAALAERAGLSPDMVYRVESGAPASNRTAASLAVALGRRLELGLIDPRQRAVRPSLSVDLVHAAMGELEAGHLQGHGHVVSLDEPYQHFQFAGRADVVAWDVGRQALLHIENRTRFPDFQDMAGAFNAKRAYLGAALAERLGIGRWSSEAHVIAALWTGEVLHALRSRRHSFRALCPDPVIAFDSWWAGRPAGEGRTSALIVIDPRPAPRARPYIDLQASFGARPRYRGYAEVAAALGRRGG